MRALRHQLAHPQGIALPLVLMALLLLSTLALALLSLSTFESQVSKNLAAAEQARFVAEAGIEWAFNTLHASLDWDSFLVGSDPARGAILVADSAIPGQSASQGTYTVRVRNDSLAGDQLVTGVPPDRGGPADDTNSLLVITSVGRVGGASRALQAVLERIDLPPVPAALALPGNTAALNVSGSFEIDGNDWASDGGPGSCAPVFGIAVSSVLPASAPGANEAAVEAALAVHPPARVQGKKQDGDGPVFGANTIAPDAALTASRVDSFVGAARKADIVLEAAGPGGLSLSEIGAGCASDWRSAACWGTVERPKVVYVKGTSDHAGAAPVLEISGSAQGHGVLIVEDAELWIRGDFLWRGIIVVTGHRVAMGFSGGGN
ncbi:MAG: hypothetical protein HY724_02860, partial [Candidatus Rokubacteria bacterium]|nr:hypothetical protein [Candidatus Rokubacteria bacterium]